MGEVVIRIAIRAHGLTWLDDTRKMKHSGIAVPKTGCTLRFILAGPRDGLRVGRYPVNSK